VWVRTIFKKTPEVVTWVLVVKFGGGGGGGGGGCFCLISSVDKEPSTIIVTILGSRHDVV